MANHEAVAALPVSGDVDKAGLRALLTRRLAYALADSESATTFVAADPATSVIPLYLIQANTLFRYDSTDTTSAHDGVTVLVSSDGKRFKNQSFAGDFTSVLTKSTSAQPGSPSVGDTYLIPTAATGTDWAGKDGRVGIYTAGGWRFAILPVGHLLYVRDETAIYHKNASGVWTAGIGSITLASSSVKITNVLGANASFVVRVENQTTNTPPASPVAPVAYIIGPAPTGAWAGNTGKMAVCLVNGTFTIITPVAGDVVYDKALGLAYQYNGTTWVSQSGAIVNSSKQFTASGSTTTGGTGSYTISATTAPTTAQTYIEDSVTISYAARRTGARLRFGYGCTQQGGSGNCVIALFMDAGANAVDWIYNSGGQQFVFDNQTAPDTSSHTYKIRFIQQAGSGVPGALNRRYFSIEEFA
jgi:hypothetical protein